MSIVECIILVILVIAVWFYGFYNGVKFEKEREKWK